MAHNRGCSWPKCDAQYFIYIFITDIFITKLSQHAPLYNTSPRGAWMGSNCLSTRMKFGSIWITRNPASNERQQKTSLFQMATFIPNWVINWGLLWRSNRHTLVRLGLWLASVHDARRSKYCMYWPTLNVKERQRQTECEAQRPSTGVGNKQ